MQLPTQGNRALPVKNEETVSSATACRPCWVISSRRRNPCSWQIHYRTWNRFFQKCNLIILLNVCKLRIIAGVPRWTESSRNKRPMRTGHTHTHRHTHTGFSVHAEEGADCFNQWLIINYLQSLGCNLLCPRHCGRRLVENGIVPSLT